MRNLDDIRDDIIETLLPDIVFDGLNWAAVTNAAAKAGFDKGMAEAVFPDRLRGAIAHFSDWADRQMMERLQDIDPGSLRVRDRIRAAVLARMEVLSPHREAVRLVISYWTLPPRGAKAGGVLWRTADRIWTWAGDTATDYNKYTKRGLLCGVIASTTLAWLSSSDDPGLRRTAAFLDRRIENVMQLGRILGKMKKAS